MSGTIISIRRPMSSTCIFRGCAPRSTKASSGRCFIRFAARGTSSVTAFGKLIRTTAFRLTLAYLFLFALFAASLLGYFAWNTRRMITEQITTTVNAEVGEISDIFAGRGLRGLVNTIENRALRPGANLYLVTEPTGQGIAGNVGALAAGVMSTSGWSETAYRRHDEQDTADHRALVHVTELDNGFRLLIGAGLEERRGVFW